MVMWLLMNLIRESGFFKDNINTFACILSFKKTTFSGLKETLNCNIKIKVFFLHRVWNLITFEISIMFLSISFSFLTLIEI